MSAGEWAVVITARTHTDDTWTRVSPDGTVDPWLHAVVADLTGPQGERLELGPRFALSRRGSRVFVAVACMARDLSANLAQDQQRRDLYCSVGWVADEPCAAPSYGRLTEEGLRWAAPEYVRWLTPDWTSSDPLGKPHAAPAAASPWTAEPVAGVAFPEVPAGHFLHIPPGRLPDAWAALAGDSGRDGTVVGTYAADAVPARRPSVADVIAVTGLREPALHPRTAPAFGSGTAAELHRRPAPGDDGPPHGRDERSAAGPVRRVPAQRMPAQRVPGRVPRPALVWCWLADLWDALGDRVPQRPPNADPAASPPRHATPSEPAVPSGPDGPGRTLDDFQARPLTTGGDA
ncbi:hypothetical protein ACFPIJ_22255 [Dactylosporangium cerinum]|uniref:Uncharacterized protein n=1 Tax=Dactylosporangium cerinum TaxID=1434730 RepID=A0ABV9VYF4_9ACTN